MKRNWVIALVFCVSTGWHAERLLLPIAVLATDKPRAEPQLLSVFPMGASQGARSQVEVRGQSLENAYAVWFDCPSIAGLIKTVEEIKPDQEGTSPKAPPGHRLALELTVAPGAGVGTHFIRIVSSRGVSNPLPFVVYQEPVVVETDLSTDPTPAARRLSTLPVVVSGKIGGAGEIDYYSFEVQPGQELFFEVLHAGRFDPQISVYEAAGSWFDPHALRRLAFNDEPNLASKNLSPALTYRFDKKGRFLAAVGAFLGRGGPDCSYQLRIVPAQPRGIVMTAPRLAHETEGHWQERTFARVLDADRLKVLGERNVVSTEEKSLGQGESQASSLDADAVGNERPAKLATQNQKSAPGLTLIAGDDSERAPNAVSEIPVPSLIEGTINRPGDVDRFKFRVLDGARLAFEIETPAKPAPFLTPRLGVFDAAGQEVLNNVYTFMQGSGEFLEKVVEPKITYKFERGGEYVLEIQDLISRNGGPDFRYRVLMRPQIPHVGRVEVASSFGRTFDGSITTGPELQRLNLVQGQATKVTVLTEQEEGFEGQIAINLEGLPPGIEVFPATEVEPERARPLDEGKKERFRSGQQLATIMLAVASNAPLTRLPQIVRLKARPVVNGIPGPALPVHSFPVMVVKLEEVATEKANAGTQSRLQAPGFRLQGIADCGFPISEGECDVSW